MTPTKVRPTATAKFFRLSPEQRAIVEQAPLMGEATNKVRLALDLLGATQDALAQVVKIDKSDISDIVNNKKPRLPLVTAQRIARVFGFDCVDHLFPMVARKRAA
jgi:DNA-binding XRE family transcriptional regulator